MKKVLSVILAVALVVCFATGALSVSAETTNLLAQGVSESTIYANDIDGSEVAMDGSKLVITVKKPWEGIENPDSDVCYGAGIPVKVENNGDIDLYCMLDIQATVPFRFTIRDNINDKWLAAGAEWFDLFYKDGQALTVDDVQDYFLPAGDYQVAINAWGYYKWQNENAGGSFTKSEITAIYIEGREAGTITVNNLSLVPNKEATHTTGDDGKDYVQYTPVAGGDTQAPTTTTKAADGSNVGGGSAQTGDESNVVLFSVVAALAVAVVTVSAVASKKAKSK